MKLWQRAVSWILLGGYAVLAISPALAQDDEDLEPLDTSGDIRIEAVVFAFPGKGKDAALPESQTAAASGQLILKSGSGNYVELPSNERKLGAAHARLLANADTKPLAFSAWQQGFNDQRWIAIQGEGVRGRLLLKPGKPLSLRVELQYLDQTSTEALSFRLRATRAAHFGETLYFDHPAFGTLVRIDQVSASTNAP
jgi:hypothetical protein